MLEIHFLCAPSQNTTQQLVNSSVSHGCQNVIRIPKGKLDLEDKLALNLAALTNLNTYVVHSRIYEAKSDD